MDVLQNPKYSYLLGKQPFFYKVFKTLFYFYSKLVFSTYAPTSVVGRENVPDSSFILCSNHNSHMDVALLAVATKKNFNDFGMLAARDYWFESWIKRVSVNTVMNLIPVDRASNKEKELSIKESEALCDAFMEYEQRNLILFPEGTRGNPGELLPFKKGAARFALNLKKPILPAVIFGSHKICMHPRMPPAPERQLIPLRITTTNISKHTSSTTTWTPHTTHTRIETKCTASRQPLFHTNTKIR